MAETQKIQERTYVVPLRRHWVNVPKYKRARKAAVALKEFIAKHMKVPERDVDKVKLDVYLNNFLWFRGESKPPAKIKVKAIKEGDTVKVVFFETPEAIKHLKNRHDKVHKAAEKSAPKAEQKKEEKVQTEEQKKDEVEKEKAVEELNIKQAETAQKVEKHASKVKEPKINRMALKK
jgi:large subunit ribosomal protein L31e